MKKKEHVIQQIVPGSIAEEMEIEPGDVLVEINGQEIEDIFDYQYYCEDYEIVVTIRKSPASFLRKRRTIIMIEGHPHGKTRESLCRNRY